jgi:hypothetical protein
MMIRVELPTHLRTLARLSSAEVELDVPPPVTLGAAIDALEARFPTLLGTVRDHGAGKRRPFVRFFVCQEDWSHEPWDTPLPDAITEGREALLVVGAVAGG